MRACDNARRTGRSCFSGAHAAVANGDRGVVIIVGRKLERGTSHLYVKLSQAVTPEPFSVSRDSTLIGATRTVERREDTIAFGEVEELVLEGIPTDRLEWRLQRLRESATVLITVSGVVTSECCVAVELTCKRGNRDGEILRPVKMTARIRAPASGLRLRVPRVPAPVPSPFQ